MNTIQERLSKDEIAFVTVDLNLKVGSDSTFVGHVMGKHGPRTKRKQARAGVTMNPTQFEQGHVGLNEEIIGLVSDVLEGCANKRLSAQLIKRL